MPTTNELLHDALIRRQIYLSKFSDGLSRDIIKLLDDTEADIRGVLAARLADLEGAAFSPRTNSRLNALAAAINKIRSSAFDATAEMWDENLQAVAIAEADFLDDALKRYSPVVLDTLLPSATLLGGIVATNPMQGAVLKTWADRLKAADAQRILDAIRIGMAQGEDMSTISRRVVGTRSLDGADGVTATTRRDADSITRTAVQTIANEARRAYTEANDDIMDREAFVATLDSRTTKICMALDGKIYKTGVGPQPPMHWRCRSLRIGLVTPQLIGTRAADSRLGDSLTGLTGKARAERIAELVGQVPARTTYQEFLTRQTVAFQDEVLGPSRAKLFRDGGLTLDRFVSRDGGEYTLAQLRTREPAAFERAGL